MDDGFRFCDVANRIIEAGRRLDSRGWVLGTSGNFSAVLSRDPLRLAITASGTAKGALTIDQVLEMDEAGRPVGQPDPGHAANASRPSAEAQLHLEIVRCRGAGAVFHTHSVWSTIASDRPGDGLAIEGYEMLKGLEGVTTHEHREWIPILDNDQDMTRLAGNVRGVFVSHPAAHAFLLRRHGMYTWGRTLEDAVRHVEIVEFLLEIVARGDERATSVVP